MPRPAATPGASGSETAAASDFAAAVSGIEADFGNVGAPFLLPFLMPHRSTRGGEGSGEEEEAVEAGEEEPARCSAISLSAS